MKYTLSITLLLLIFISPVQAQIVNSAEPKANTNNKESSYDTNEKFYSVKTYPQFFKTQMPKNIILMIGDGMGVAAISAAITANGGNLFLDNFRHVGFSKTQSANRYVTDSSAGGTAIAIGQKTKNGYIGLNAEGDTIQSILKHAQLNGLATGIVNTNEIFDATPAAFYAHTSNRKDWEEIVSQLANANIDVFIGGSGKQFTTRTDNRNIYEELKAKGYNLYLTHEELKSATGEKIAGLLPFGRISKRGDFLPTATNLALTTLSTKGTGFFLMVEGSYIDGGGHRNDMEYLMEEMLDFDRAIGQALEFAAQDGETLIIVTADHETGGVSVVAGDKREGKVTGRFSTVGHTGSMVPIFAYGPGADRFTGINENTFFFNNILELLGINSLEK